MEIKETVSRLQKVPVVAFEEGLRLGRVSDVYIDRQARQVCGISFKSGLWGKENIFYIELSDILKIGKDVIIVASQAAAQPLTGQKDESSLKKLRGFKITSQDGAYIGELVDLNVNREDGRISEIILNDSRAIEVEIEDIALGPDVIVVPADYATRIRHVESEKSGILSRVFDSSAISESFRDTYEGIKESVRSGKGAEKMMEVLKSGSEKTRDTVLRTSRKIQDTVEQIRKKRENETEAPHEENANQGTEAEHAGKTYFESFSEPVHPSGFQGPEQDSSENADLDEKTEEDRK